MSPNLNIFVASFTTSWARLHLNKALQLLGERVLYNDTDSIIYLEEPDQPKPLLGDYLGEFTSELDTKPSSDLMDAEPNSWKKTEQYGTLGPKRHAVTPYTTSWTLNFSHETPLITRVRAHVPACKHR